MSSIKLVNQDILVGSLKVLSNTKKFDKHDYMKKNMFHNLAYQNFLKKNKTSDPNSFILNSFIQRYQAYRDGWNIRPLEYFESSTSQKQADIPMCIDIETASICDLACPHCFREYVVTPDKVMSLELYTKIINEIDRLKVPSVKLNWRGEPLLNPNLVKMIELAKNAEVLDVSINTNATRLDERKAKDIINSGLDQIIFSFDGGTKKTYEKFRPGRFHENKFEDIYNNIKNFCKLKKELGKFFPITKIQMVLAGDQKNEIKDFFQLFEGYIDDITITPYSERGGNIDDLNLENKKNLKNYIDKNNLRKDTPYLIQGNDQIYISEGRVPCFQPLQRLMITYNGMVSMCCHDWGAQHCIGYIDEDAFNNENETKKVVENINLKKRGFELLQNAKEPNKYNIPEKKISSLSEIWKGESISKVRQIHKCGDIDSLIVCKKCSFKDTFKWKKI
jgi:MoaA/NifB/PqqE/SkfB family radical SAM enzyme